MIVYVLQYSHRHGEDFTAYATMALAVKAAADLCHHYADECQDSTAAQIECVRRLHADGRWEDCIGAYCEARDDELFDIHELGLVVPGRPTCDECGEFTDDDGECGECVNCRMPLCLHHERAVQQPEHADHPCSCPNSDEAIALGRLLLSVSRRP